ncbi:MULTISPECIES: OsmC family protein [Halomonadaceae]|jgi:osmotically inducible protein OsmC|uniref:OsmC family protein n=1 Tax=Halomonadaceae TaxID=28256 RepID=UPI000A28AC6B|nr:MULTISPECIES: OsmC family protein [Halomonas]MCO7246330.1 OsmC family protein [Halomonas sp. Mc5H-6]MCW4148661.1 OsmC family protein [Halomonas sp. 18H]MCZ0930360.1 OsmC family protein [Halomonas janggokensis]MDR5884840.1 OsmC family protein [Halomonas janggokensis]QPL45143.1 OsmC family protein [Halomonas sp. A40-4]
MDRKASARWEGGLKDGRGHVATESGVLDASYSFKKRFEDEKGTNPEELIGAAHASCFSMALSMVLGEKDLTATSIETSANVTLSQSDAGFDISKIHLDVEAQVDGADEATFKEAAETAKANCPVSKVLNAEISMTAKLKH